MALEPRLRVLLLGGNGQLGRALHAGLADGYEIIAPSRAQCNVCDTAALARQVAQARPTAIVNAAAYTDVDAAEDAPQAALAVNGHAPAVLAELANRYGALLLHYSSDYVFDGDPNRHPGRPYGETDAPAPVNAYGRSKWAGDAAAARAARHLILRAGWLHSSIGRNFVTVMRARLRTRAALKVVADQIGAPTPAVWLADVTAQLLQRYLQTPPQANFPYGLYHVAAAGHTSWHGYACHIARWLHAAELPLALQAGDIEPVSSAHWPTRARRPLDTRLDTSRLREVFGITLPAWQTGVAQTLASLTSQPDA